MRQRGMLYVAIPLAVSWTALTLTGWRVTVPVSGSVPRGLYWVRPVETMERGMLAQVRPPASWLPWLQQYSPQTARLPLLKPIAAVAGDTVCVEDEGVAIEGHLVAPVARVDDAGRPLPRWRGCVTLEEGELFLLSTYHAHSFDSRYLGPVRRASLVGTATLLLGW